MNRAHFLMAIVAATSIAAVAAVADALVVTDQERVEAIVDAVSGEVSRERIDDALSHVQTGRAPFELRAGGRQLYQDRDAELGRDIHRALAPFLGTEAELVQHDIRVNGDEAQVHVRIRTVDGLVSGSARVEKIGGRWLITEATLR